MVVIMACAIIKVKVQVLLILLAITYFCNSYITEEEINDLEKLPMLSCGALVRCNNQYIESTV